MTAKVIFRKTEFITSMELWHRKRPPKSHDDRKCSDPSYIKLLKGLWWHAT